MVRRNDLAGHVDAAAHLGRIRVRVRVRLRLRLGIRVSVGGTAHKREAQRSRL